MAPEQYESYSANLNLEIRLKMYSKVNKIKAKPHTNA